MFAMKCVLQLFNCSNCRYDSCCLRPIDLEYYLRHATAFFPITKTRNSYIAPRPSSATHCVR